MNRFFGFSSLGAAALLAAPAWAAGQQTVAQPKAAVIAQIEAPGEHARRLLDEALLSIRELEHKGLAPTDEIVAKFREAAQAAPKAVSAQFDLAVALEKAGKTDDATATWRAAAAATQGPKELRLMAAERAVQLALLQKNAQAARAGAELAARIDDSPRSRSLAAEVELASGDAQAALAKARTALMQAPKDVRALCALARAQTALGQPGTAKLLAHRAASIDARDARPHLVLAELASYSNDGVAELAELKSAAASDPKSLQAQILLGNLMLQRGDATGAAGPFEKAAQIDPDSAAARLGLGASLAAQGGKAARAIEELEAAATLAPSAAEPHLLIARLKMTDGDAATALEEARLFVKLSPQLPANHQVHALLQRAEKALAAKAPAPAVHSANGGVQ